MRPQPYESEDELDWKGTLLDRNGAAPRRGPSSYQNEPKNRIFMIGIAIGVIAILVTLYMMISGGNSSGEAPLIKADTTPYKSKPDQPGGENIPFQDKLVFNRLDPNGKPVQAEKLLPAAEEPAADKPVTAPVASAPTPPLPSNVVTAPPVEAAAPVPTAAPTTPVVAAPIIVPTPAAPVPVEETPAPLATTAPTPAPVAAPVAKVETPKAVETPKPASAAVPMQTTAATPAGQVRVQLASIPTQQNAQKALADFKTKYASALNGTGLTIVKADLGAKGIYYRIQSSPVSRATADSICSSVKAQGGACITAK